MSCSTPNHPFKLLQVFLDTVKDTRHLDVRGGSWWWVSVNQVAEHCTQQINHGFTFNSVFIEQPGRENGNAANLCQCRLSYPKVPQQSRQQSSCLWQGKFPTSHIPCKFLFIAQIPMAHLGGMAFFFSNSMRSNHRNWPALFFSQ